MAINQAYPSVNDVAASWADIKATFTVSGGALLELADFDGIKFTTKVEVGEGRGASGGRVMARTVGSVSYEASATLWRAGHRRLVKALMEQAPERGNQKLISYVPFDILIQHTPPGETEIYTTKIKGCRYLGVADDMKEGNEVDKVEVTFSTIEIVQIINGVEVALI